MKAAAITTTSQFRGHQFIIHFTLSIVHSSRPNRRHGRSWRERGSAYDEQFYRPNPVYMPLNADSTYSFGLIDANSPVQRATWSVREQSVRLDTSTYTLNQWAFSGEKLRLMGAFPMTFRRLTEFVIDSATVYRSLVGRNWATDSTAYYFHADGSACLKNPKTGDVAVHCWRLARIGHSLFVVIKGNRSDCDGNFQYPLQITQLSVDAMQCQGGGPLPNDRLLLRRGAKLATTQCEPKGFQPCRTYIFPSSNLYPYFFYRRGRLFDIRQVVEREYKPIVLPG